MDNQSFKERCHKIWAWFGLKSASRFTFYFICGLFQIGVLMECGILAISAAVLLTGAGTGWFDFGCTCLGAFTCNGFYLLFFYLLCAIAPLLLLVYFSGHFIPKAFVNAENQSFFRLLFDAARIFGRRRLFNWVLVSMYGAALLCIFIVGGAIIDHGTNPDSAFQTASDAIVTFFMALMVWHFSYHLDPLGNKLGEQFKASYYDPLMSVVRFFIGLSFFLVILLGNMDSAATFIFLLISGSLISLENFFILPLDPCGWFLSARAGAYPGLLVVIIGRCLHGFEGAGIIPLAEPHRVLWLAGALGLSVLNACLYRRFVVKPYCVMAFDAMRQLHHNKEHILFDSVNKGHHLVSAAALSCGADPDRVDPKGDALLHIAAWKDLPHVAWVLLKFGADCNRANRVNLRPLHISASRLHPDMIAVLLNYGARVNIKDMHGREPIHRICSNSRGSDCHRGMRCLKMLLKHGADPHQPDHNGTTAFDLAQKWNTSQYKRLIRKYTKPMEKGCVVPEIVG